MIRPPPPTPSVLYFGCHEIDLAGSIGFDVFKLFTPIQSGMESGVGSMFYMYACFLALLACGSATDPLALLLVYFNPIHIIPFASSALRVLRGHAAVSNAPYRWQPAPTLNTRGFSPESCVILLCNMFLLLRSKLTEIVFFTTFFFDTYRQALLDLFRILD
jgi:hypothetical protein